MIRKAPTSCALKSIRVLVAFDNSYDSFDHSIQKNLSAQKESSARTHMNSMKLVIPLQSLYWSIHTKDESKRSSAIDSSVVVSQNRLESLFHQIKCDRMTSFMEFMLRLGQIRGVFTPKWCAKLLMDVGFLEYYYIQLITFCSQVKVSEIFID